MDTPNSSNSPKADPKLESIGQRMLTARDRIRRYFSQEAIAGTDPDAAEVIGQGSTADGKADDAR